MHIWKIKRLLLPKRRKVWWNPKRWLFKNHRNCSLRTSMKGHLFRTFNSYSCISKVGYVTAVLAIVRTELRAQEASSFCELWKVTCSSHLILLFWLEQRIFFKMCLVRSIIANLCPVMIHLNALDFNLCRSEEVMFLLTLRVWAACRNVCLLDTCSMCILPVGIINWMAASA